MDKKLFEEIGLANSEIIVYTTLLKVGSIKVGELMKEVSLHRSRVYEAINRLTEKGLVSYAIKNNIKYFEASEPDNLLTYVEEQKAKLEEKAIKAIIPELKKNISQLKPHAEAHVFIGKEGFKTIRKDILKQGKDLCLIGAVGKEYEFTKYFFPNFDKLRVQKGIKWKILYDYEVKEKDIPKRKLFEYKFLPKEYSSPAVIDVYADRVVNVLWEGENPICFMLINQKIADSYRKWFEMMWKYSK